MRSDKVSMEKLFAQIKKGNRYKNFSPVFKERFRRSTGCRGDVSE
jgi:hypothetical protein